MVRILGIDPGSRITGFGVIERSAGKLRYIESGAIRMLDRELPLRLKTIFKGVNDLVSLYQPDEVAIERVFMHRNPDSALKLGQARGAAICGLINHDLAIHEYTPAEIKKAAVGRGNASKEQVQHMVQALLKLPAQPQADAADALAVAICHSHIDQTLGQIGAVRGSRRGRYR